VVFAEASLRAWCTLALDMVSACYFALFKAIYDTLRTLSLWPQHEATDAWTAIAVFSAGQGITVVSLQMWSNMLGAPSAMTTRAQALSLYLGLFALNYWAVRGRGRWDAYLQSLRTRPHRTQRRIEWAARVSVLLVAIGCASTSPRT
jgi:hypothetical protein